MEEVLIFGQRNNNLSVINTKRNGDLVEHVCCSVNLNYERIAV